MNIQLIDSIVQLINTLSPEEQKTVIAKLNNLIQPTKKQTSEPIIIDEKEYQDAWEAFLSLGDNAAAGKLENPSINHDKYLYQQP